VKRLRFEYEVFTIVEFSREEMSAISEVCLAHYDTKVRELARMFLPKSDELRAEIRFSYRQLDTLSKAMEMATTVAERAIKITVGALLREASAERMRVEPWVEPKP